MLVACLVAAMYADVFPSLVHDWWELPVYSQAFLVVPLTFYAVWRERSTILLSPALPDLRGLWLTAFACVVYIWGRLAASNYLPRLSAILLAAGLFWTFWGRRRLSRLAFPLVVLASVIPLPSLLYSQLATLLQLLASRLSMDLARFAGAPAYREGNMIYLANITLAVGEACSGLHSLASLIVVALLLGYIECSRNVTRIALCLSAIPTAVFFNILRLTITAFLSELNPDLASGFYHSLSGWLIFVMGFCALAATGKALRILLEPRGRAVPA